MVNIGWWVVGGGAPATMAAQTSSTAHRDMTVANAVRTTCPRLRCATGTSPTSSSSPPYISVHCLPIPKHALGFHIVGVVDCARLPTLPTTYFLLCVPASGLSVESNSPAAARGDRVTDITVIQYRMHPKSHLHDTAPWTWIVAGCFFRSTTCSHIECTIYTSVPISRVGGNVSIPTR